MAVEFALIVPPFLALVLGGLSVCVLYMFSNVSLQNAVEQGARCYSVQRRPVRQRLGEVANLCAKPIPRNQQP